MTPVEPHVTASVWRLEAVLARIDDKIAALRGERRNLVATIKECRAGRCRFAPP